MNQAPQIVKCEVTGLCWQVEFWMKSETGNLKPEMVVLKRGSRVETVPVDGFFEKYTEVC